MTGPDEDVRERVLIEIFPQPRLESLTHTQKRGFERKYGQKDKVTNSESSL